MNINVVLSAFQSVQKYSDKIASKTKNKKQNTLFPSNRGRSGLFYCDTEFNALSYPLERNLMATITFFGE